MVEEPSAKVWLSLVGSTQKEVEFSAYSFLAQNYEPEDGIYPLILSYPGGSEGRLFICYSASEAAARVADLFHFYGGSRVCISIAQGGKIIEASLLEEGDRYDLASMDILGSC